MRPNSVCAQARAAWMAAFDAESGLSAAATSHVEGCAGCRAFTTAAEAARRVLEAMPLPGPNLAADARLLAELRGSVPAHPRETPASPRWTRVLAWSVSLALLGGFLTLLALPGYRAMLVGQVRTVLTGRAFVPGYDARTPAERATHRRRLEAVLRRRPDDARSQLGLLPARPSLPQSKPDLKSTVYDPTAIRDPRVEYLGALYRRFPGDRVVLAELARHYCDLFLVMKRVELVRRPDGTVPSNEPDHSQWLAPTVVRRVEVIAAEGERLDPDNALYPTLLAAAYFGAGRDSKAHASLGRAGRCATWKDYSTAEGDAARDLNIAAYGDRGFWMHAVPEVTPLLWDVTRGQQVGRLAAIQAHEAGAAGNQRREHDLNVAVIRLGRLMRLQADSRWGRLTGRRVEETAFGTYSGKYRSLRAGDPEYASRRIRAEYAARVRRAAPEYAPLVDAEQHALDGLGAAGWAAKPWLNHLCQVALHRDSLGLSLAANLLACLALWAVAAVAIRVSNRIGPPRRDWGRWFWEETPWLLRSTLIGLAVFGLLIASLLYASLLPPRPHDESGPNWTMGTSLVPVLGVLLVFLAVLRRRDGAAASWNSLHGGLVALVSLGILALGTYPFLATVFTDGYWAGVGFGRGMVETWTAAVSFNSIGIQVFPAPVPVAGALLLAPVLVALARRAGVAGAFEALRRGAAVTSAILAAGYLVYLLVAVPADLRAGREFDRLYATEQAGRAPGE